MRVYLTEKAGALHEEVRNTFRELDRELTAVLGENERDILVASLLKVHHHLSQTNQEPERSGPGQPPSLGDEGKEKL